MKFNLKYFLILLSLILFCTLATYAVIAQTQGGFKSIKQEFYKWNKVNGKAYSGLTRRRASEAQLFEGNTSNIGSKISYEETQLGMNDQAYKTFDKTDKELNKIYQQILVEYKDDKVFISKLQKAELAWIKYRDAETEAIFPEDDKRNYGSVYPMCRASILTELTQQRIKELKTWSKGICEGNVCAGSRKFCNDGDCIP